jgi:hypothetical protein
MAYERFLKNMGCRRVRDEKTQEMVFWQLLPAASRRELWPEWGWRPRLSEKCLRQWPLVYIWRHKWFKQGVFSMVLFGPELFIPLALSAGIGATATAVLRLGLGESLGRVLAGLGLGLGILFGWLVVIGFKLPPNSLIEVMVHGLLGAVVLGGVLQGSSLRIRWLGWLLAAYAAFCVWAALGRPTMWSGFGLLVGAGLLATGWAVVLVRLYVIGRREDAEAWGVVISLAGGIALIAWAAGSRGLVAPALIVMAAGVGAACVAIPLRLPFGLLALTSSGGALMWLVQALAVPRPTLTAPLAIAALGLFAGTTGRRLPLGARMGPLWSAVLAIVPALLAALLAASLPF